MLIIPQTKACFGECEVIKLTQVILHRKFSFQNELSMISQLPVHGEIISVFLMCLKYRMGYVIIIYKTNISSSERINYRCRLFDLMLFAVLTHSLGVMNAVAAVQVFAILIISKHIMSLTINY